MSCVNIKHPVFQKVLSKVSNPLKAEIMFDRLMNTLEDKEQYNKYAEYLSDDIAKTVLLESPSITREQPNVYKVSLHKDSNKILALDQAFEVAKARLNTIDKKYGVANQRSLGRVSDEKGPVLLTIEPNKQHMINYILDSMLAEEADKEGIEEMASIETPEPTDRKQLAIKKATAFNDTLKNIAKNIGVDVKFVESLINSHGNTLNGLFSVTKDLKGLIQVSKESTDDLTLSEELSHAIIDGFENLPVLQNILRLVKSEGYAKFLGDNVEAYEKMYNGNKELLIKEAAGKALSQALYNKFEQDSESKLTKALKAFWNRMKSLFSKVDSQSISDLDNALNDLSKVILGEELTTAEFKSETSLASVRKTPKLIKKDPYADAIVRMKQNIGRLNAKLASLSPENDMYDKVKDAITNAQTKLAQYYDTKNKSYFKEAAEEMLAETEDFVNTYEESGKLPTAAELQQITTFLDSIKGIVDVNQLISRFNEIQKDYVEKLASDVYGRKQEYEELTDDKEDISMFTKSFNTLINLKDKLAYTIGFLIKRAQIEISSKQGDLYNDVRKYVDDVTEWAKENSIDTSKMYDVFIQKYKDTTILTRPYSEEFYSKLSKAFKDKDYAALNKIAFKNEETGKWIPYDMKKYRNENYTKIMSEPRLKAFYEYYERTMKESLSRLPKRDTRFLNEDFIPNIMLNSLADVTKATTFRGKIKNLMKYTTGINSTEVLSTDFLKNEALERDLVPLKYLKKITGEVKSNDLGESLFKFAAFTIEHEHLSEVLPQTRILQNAIANTNYISSTDPTGYKIGSETNLHEMVDRFIDMQLRGNKKKAFYKYNTEDIKNEKGEVIGTKQVDVADAIDFGLTWNSLLRIGLNPITAFTNILVGEAGNAIEAIGGRFYNKADLTEATGIFFKDITDKESKFNYIIEKYPLMQELTDYEYASKLRVAKGLTGEQLKNYMYQMQKSGEVFLQGRTMIAMMLHTKPDGKTSFWEMLDEKGNLKEEFKHLFPDFNEYMVRTSMKVIGVNAKIHGRYSGRDAAIINQNVLWRMMFQFKKWIPAAIESRFEGKRFDETLGVEVEGRWVTMWKMLSNIKDTAARYDRGELSELEVYNFKKTATEAVLILGSILMYAALGWDDDEKKKRSAMYKFTMDQLDRVSGDLLFFANPRNVTALTKNPIAMTKLADDLISVTRNVPYIFNIGEYQYKSGPRKGENKFWSKVTAVTPGAKPASDFIRLFNEEKYRDYTP